MFDFIPPELDEMYIYMESMDVNSASCITGINAKICKSASDSIPSKFRHLFATSLNFSKFPAVWARAHVTLLPKSGDKKDPGNWRAQGTVLGPLVFIFYINDCIYRLKNVKISMFADDCILIYSGNNWPNIHNIMQKDLDNFVRWASNNRLRLNESKTL